MNETQLYKKGNSMTSQTIAVIILTKNEEKHIRRCISSAKLVSNKIIVVDSFSDDRTCEIAEECRARVYKHKFINQAYQFNWALGNCEIHSEWVWRLDADEYIEKELAREVISFLRKLPSNSDINGIYVNKKIVFLGHPLLHGGWYPAKQIKIIRRNHGGSENKWMDEHLITYDGNCISINGDQTDENLNDLTWWTNKHNQYAQREAINMLMIEYGMEQDFQGVKPKFFGNNSERKRWFKIKYAKLPLFFRPVLNFFFRYVVKGGFLDGKTGFIWYVLQCFWYRFLVDAKIFELKKKFNWDKEKIKQYIAERYILPTQSPNRKL